jgi:subtilisin family serine protease/photosystem II stability/assembly factor-like uncharacterized protein
MKNKIIILALSLLIANFPAISKPNIPITTSHNGLLVTRPGKNVDGKWMTLSQTKVIEKVAQKYYLQNAIYVKLKTKAEISKDKKSIKNYRLQSELQTLSVSQFDVPFEKFISNNEDDAYGISRIYKVNYELPVDPYVVCEEIMQDPEVEYASPIFIREKYDFTPNDPSFLASQQSYLYRMNMPKAWEKSKGSKAIKIAIVDSAIDWKHEDLSDNIWTNPNEIPGNGIDDDKNGFVDDVHGWDFVGNISSYSSNLLPDNDTKPTDPNNNHGTHVAGCASAILNNAIGVASIGGNCSIIPIKVSADNNQLGGILSGYEGILYASKLGADVINCSWGGPGYSPAEEDIVNTAVSKGAVIVVAAGNNSASLDANNDYPAAFKSTFSVGSIAASNQASSFSDYGISVDIWTYGENIYSTTPNNTYGYESGTSMASPIIAGLVGNLKSLHPTWTPQQLMLHIRGTAANNINTAQQPYYFGSADPLKAFEYNNGDVNKQIPGIALNEVLINGKSEISDYQTNQLKVSFKNYLSPASNVQVTLTPLDSWVVLEQNTFSINSIASDEVKSLEFNLSLTKDCPWFSGYTRLLAKVVSSDYINYELISLPIKLQSDNVFITKISNASNPSVVQINAIKMIDDDRGWVIGNDRLQNKGIYGKVNGTQFQLNYMSNNPCYALYVFDQLNAFVGTGTDDGVGTSEILHTTDGANTWKSINTSSITNFINFIHFYDSQNGIMLGDPKGTVWGAATTTDGGATWNLLTTLPPALNGEDGLVGSGQFDGDNIWFGTTMGRVFTSNDRGKSWMVTTITLGKPVVDLSFSSPNNGFVIFSDDLRATSGRYVAMTSDGAQSWKIHPTINFTNQGLLPIYAFSPTATNKQYLLFYDGEVKVSEDNGNSWSPVLSKQYDNYLIGTYNLLPGKVHLWELGSALCYLEFKYEPASIVKQISLVDNPLIDFGNIEVNKSKTKFLKLKNTGNYTTSVLSYVVVPDEGTQESEFLVKSDLPTAIDVGTTINFRLGFAPLTTGTKSATLKLITDGNPANIEFKVTGIGDPSTSVFDEVSDTQLLITPNPSIGNILVKFDAKSNLKTEIKVYNYLNQIVHSSKYETKLGTNEINLNLNNLNSGFYYVTIQNGNEILMKQIIINK